MAIDTWVHVVKQNSMQIFKPRVKLSTIVGHKTKMRAIANPPKKRIERNQKRTVQLMLSRKDKVEANVYKRQTYIR